MSERRLTRRPVSGGSAPSGRRRRRDGALLDRGRLPTATAVKSIAPTGCESVVNVNKAGVEELEELPGIGPVKAQAIVDYRNAHGDFANVEELDEVEGIGEKTLEKIEPCVIFE